MPRLVLLSQARADLDDILSYITQESGSASTGKNYIAKLAAKMRSLAALPGPFGRPRPELLDGLRSAPCASHVIFFGIEVTRSKSSTSCTAVEISKPTSRTTISSEFTLPTS